MRHVAAVFGLLLLQAPMASAQTAAPPPYRHVAASEASYLLASYMAQLASAGTPPSQADIEQATQQYFTNGAAVYGVPASGPASAYFQNGAAAMAYPPAAGVSGASGAAAGASAGLDGGAPSGDRGSNDSGEQEAGALASAAQDDASPSSPSSPSLATETGGPPTARIRPAAPGVAGPNCATLDEVEAAMAIASHFEPPSSSPGSSTSSTASTAAPAGAPTVPASPSPPEETAAEPALRCPPHPSALTPVATALGGVLFGGLAVVLGSRWSRRQLPRNRWPREAR